MMSGQRDQSIELKKNLQLITALSSEFQEQQKNLLASANELQKEILSFLEGVSDSPSIVESLFFRQRHQEKVESAALLKQSCSITITIEADLVGFIEACSEAIQKK